MGQCQLQSLWPTSSCRLTACATFTETTKWPQIQMCIIILLWYVCMGGGGREWWECRSVWVCVVGVPLCVYWVWAWCWTWHFCFFQSWATGLQTSQKSSPRLRTTSGNCCKCNRSEECAQLTHLTVHSMYSIHVQLAAAFELVLTPSLPWCHWKTTSRSETITPFCLPFCTGKDFHQNA